MLISEILNLKVLSANSEVINELAIYNNDLSITANT